MFDKLDDSEQETDLLKDLDAVQKDDAYELLYISKEDGVPFFTSNLIHHMRMMKNFDKRKIPGEHQSILYKIDCIVDRDLQRCAEEIIENGSNILNSFYQEALSHKSLELSACLNKSVMALMLASHPKNFSQNSGGGKSCKDYFYNFIVYLRLALETDDYKKWRATTSETLPKFTRTCLKLIHFLCNELFLKKTLYQTIITFIRNLVGKTVVFSDNFWEKLLQWENGVRMGLSHYASSPFMKALQFFESSYKEGGVIREFDPIMQGNLPFELFHLNSELIHATVIHLPGPTHQEFIEKAVVNVEFKGFLRSLRGQRFLYINLQDRGCWKDDARVSAMEKLSQEGEFVDVIKVITLAKHTDFYHQINDFAQLSKSLDFCHICIDQILDEDLGGFFLPENTISKETIKKLVFFVHDQFFDKKANFTHKEKLDFIEILYFFLVLKIMDQEKPDVISFSCKDGVDLGSAMSGVFYGFARILSSSKPWGVDDENFCLFTFFAPPLLVRGRSISSSCFQRAVSALQYFNVQVEKNRDKILSATATLFPEASVVHLKVG